LALNSVWVCACSWSPASSLCAAMCCLTEQRTQSALSAVAEFATVANQVNHEELRAASQQVALEGLSLCESYGRRCVRFLLEALQSASRGGAAAVNDVVWMLYKLARKSDQARAWVMQDNGLEVLLAALVVHPGEAELLADGVWLAYALDGLQGFAALLARCGGSSPGHVAIRGAVVWSIYELVQGCKDGGAQAAAERAASQPRPESAAMLALLVEAMRHESTAQDTQWTCCMALDILITGEPRFGTYFLDHSGAQMLIRMLRSGKDMNANGGEFRKALAYLIASLADCSLHVAERLRNEGALRALSEHGIACAGGDGKDVEGMMWAIGALGGLSAVMEVMEREGSSRPAVLRGGVLAICECTWHATDDREDLVRLPRALTMVLEVIRREEALSPHLRDLIKALGSVLACIAPHAPPGELSDVDVGVEYLLRRFQEHPSASLSSSADAGQDSSNERTADPLVAATEVTAEAIGRIALVAPLWRQALRHCGTLDGLRHWIRCGGAPRRLHKYLFWAAAAIGGLPFVTEELRLHMQLVAVVDAGLCTIIDILDDDIDGEYSLVGVERGAEMDMSLLFKLVVEAMRSHSGAPEVQARAGHCVGLLASLASDEVLGAIAPAAASSVLAGARRFPRRSDVAGGACAALRTLCSLRPRRPAVPPPGNGCAQAGADGWGALAALQAALKDEGAAECADQIMTAFSSRKVGRSNIDILEDAVAVLALLRGVEPVLQRLLDEYSGSPLRPAGLKALFEVGRSDIRLFAGAGVAAAAAEACARLVAEEAEEPGSRLHEVAALLSGLCMGAVANAHISAGR